ncbi:energy-coupling factor transporter ATPase [Fructilactobacillus myrtifloralis]|uniref:Energy-coupling factor transporter ATPase n=1 Tax=Fructilactobacillus myrtifloralis TaxID=2940301 RepID=A0ABY5BLD8_9LACO|nr:energy-coupling factor transporter ATPase [Fructilactobacillus myrtifloralis]USS84477.1 energy-coupling factor transporter ATPase [Fructilactobacillus myrtifloralis]
MKQAHGIVVQHVHFQYPNQPQPLLTDVSFQVPAGQWWSVLGSNGSGKSTLLKLLVGLERPQAGQLLINGQAVVPITEGANPTVGLVLQNPDNQFVGATVADDVAFGLGNQGWSQSEVQARVKAALQSVDMTAALQKAPDELSGGQKQRVALASVLARRPAVLLLDEATSMLDPQGRTALVTKLHQLQRQLGLTVVEVTHQPAEAELADQVVVLHAGHIVQQGAPAAVFAHPERLLAWGIQAPLRYRLRSWLANQGYPLAVEQVAHVDDLRDALWQLRSQT